MNRPYLRLEAATLIPLNTPTQQITTQTACTCHPKSTKNLQVTP